MVILILFACIVSVLYSIGDKLISLLIADASTEHNEITESESKIIVIFTIVTLILKWLLWGIVLSMFVYKLNLIIDTVELDPSLLIEKIKTL